jgi:H+-transporting ATPase
MESSRRVSSREYEEISTEEVFRLLESREEGLSDEEAERRLQIFGPNAIEERKESPLKEFLRRFWGPMPWLLEIAILLSFLIGHTVEALIIAFLLFVNAIIGFAHSQSSKKVLELLRSKLAIMAKVIRSGQLKLIDAKNLVPGDVLIVELGDIIPADCKILEGSISVDQSALTGESLPVDLSRGNVAFSGSIVKRGKARCIVVNTGADTYFGKTAELVRIARPKSHQQEVMLQITRYSMYLGIAVMIAVSILAYVMHLKNELISILTFDVAILMGCVPVALPAVMTIMQAAGARYLASKGVLVTKLDAVEDAASVDVLCLDKTGTITMNSLEVSSLVPLNLSEDELLELAFYASSEETKDPIDVAIVNRARKVKIRGRRISFIPFDPSTKRSEAVVEIEGKRIRVVKGAPQIVLEMCANGKKFIEEKLNELASKGYKTLLVAKGEEGGPLEVAGIIALSDPPRPDSAELIKRLKELDVRPKMITGDSFPIAKEIAGLVGIGEKGISLSDLRKLDESRLLEEIERADFLAEVFPEDKYAVVKSLQAKGHMVGMTGDGVNDAPALKQAELGIAVSNATDVAKASAGVVLLTPGLGGIVEVIIQSRKVYQRALTWIINKVTKVIQFTLLLAVGLFWLGYDVLTLMGMALLIFANDFATMSLATDNAEPTSNPNKWNIRNIIVSSVVLGILLLIEALIAIYIGQRLFSFPKNKMQTFILLIMVFTSQFRVLLVRERRYFWKSRPGRELIASVLVIIAVFLLLGTAGIAVERIPLYASLFSLAYSAAFTLGIDPIKVLIFRSVRIS